MILATALASTAHAIIPGWGAKFTVGFRIYAVWHKGDWHYFPMDTAPVLKSGRVYVPLRFVQEAWNKSARLTDGVEPLMFVNSDGTFTEVYTYDTRAGRVRGRAFFVTGSRTLIVNGYSYQEDAAPFVKNNRIMVPLRWVTYLLPRTDVSWDPVSPSAYIYW